MVQGNEAISLILASGVLFFLFVYRQRILEIPFIRLLLAGFCSIYLGLVLTILEGFFWGGLLNLLEHLANAAGVVFLVLWVWRFIGRDGGTDWSS